MDAELPGKSTTSSNANPGSSEDTSSAVCPLCGGESLCGGLGVIRYDVSVDDPRFGKLFRCPNHRVELDSERQEKLLKISNLSAFADKTFASFHIRSDYTPEEQDSLKIALQAAHQFADNPEGWLLLKGTYGCGKTHLAAAIGNWRLLKGDMVLFITTPDLLDHLRNAYSPSSDTDYDDLFQRVRNTRMLILDDLGVENPSQWAQEKLFQLLNHRYSYRLPTVITTNMDFQRLDPRLRSRLADKTQVFLVTIEAPDYRNADSSLHDPLLLNLELYRDMTFESFDVKEKLHTNEQRNLEKALEIAQNYAKELGGWLVLTGIYYGCGKTHLAAAIAHYQRSLGKNVAFVTVPDLLDYLRDTYNPNAATSFDRRFQNIRNVDLLVLDDLGVENATPWAKEKLFQILDYRYVAQLPTIITTAKPLKELDERMQSRLMDRRRCLNFEIKGPTYASRRERR